MMIGKSEMTKRSRTESLSTQNSVLLEIVSIPRKVSFRPRKSNLSVLYAADILTKRRNENTFLAPSLSIALWEIFELLLQITFRIKIAFGV